MFGNNGNNDITTLGVVNGSSINKIDFEQKVQSKLQEEAQKGTQRGQAIDILWDQEPLLNFSSSEVWPFPGTELTTFGNCMPLYQSQYCERFECPTGSAPTASSYL